MKLFLVLIAIVGGYLYFLMHTTNIVLNQVSNLNKTYQYVANHADEIAGGEESSN